LRLRGSHPAVLQQAAVHHNQRAFAQAQGVMRPHIKHRKFVTRTATES
jgi:hypothetical protein